MSSFNDGSTASGSASGSNHGQQPKGNGHKHRPRKKKSGNLQPGNETAPSGSKHGSPKKNSHHGRTHNSRSKSPKSGRKRSPVPPRSNASADITVIVNRVDLWDIAKRHADVEEHSHHQHHHNRNLHVAPYSFAPDNSCWVSVESKARTPESCSVAVAPALHVDKPCGQQVMEEGALGVIDTSFPNPHPSSVVHDKYWCQRRRLFSRFDMGVQLDSEGWFSVTPEIIANHVAHRVGNLSDSAAFRRGMPGSNISENDGIVVLDAFCGCGGNALAFGRVPSDKISLVVCVDVDRSKLQKAAYNASLYDIPNHKLIFVECNTMFILGHCYKDGELMLDKLGANGQHVPNMPSPVQTEVYAGYRIGGLDLLPPRIDAVFMDPPWGGVDYYRLKNGYDLEEHMKILVGPLQTLEPPTSMPEPVVAGGVADDFFDMFGSQPSKPKKASKTFNETSADGEYVNGVDLVKMAAEATRSRLVIYDLPRNTNKTSLAQAAYAAGYRGNIKLEEHFLNGRLKTVTAYMGADYSSLLDG